MAWSPTLNGRLSPERRLWPLSPEDSRARDVLLSALRDDALTIRDLTLSSGTTADYYVDAKQVTLRQSSFAALSTLLAGAIRHFDASAVGGLVIGADPVVGSALATGIDIKGFLVRKERKEHGLQRLIEGPELLPEDRCLVVDDVVTQGGSVITAIERLQQAGLHIAAVVAVLDREAGGAAAVEAAAQAPFIPLTLISEIHQPASGIE